MAFPTIPTAGASTLLTSNQATATTTHTFPNLSSLPNTAGALLLAVIVKYDGNSTDAEFSSWGGGFTEFVDQAAVVTNGPGAIGAAYKLNATGSETGTFTVTSAGSGRSVMFLMEITGAHATTPPEATARATGTGAAADPAALNPAGWDAEDTLWVAVANNDETSLTGSFTGITAAPTNYTDYAQSGIIGGDVIGALEGAVAFRQNAVASEDAGGFTLDVGAAANSALLIAVRPVFVPPPDNPVHESHGLLALTGSLTTAAIPVPSGVAADDVVVVQLSKESTATVTGLPSGFTQKSQVANSGPVQHTIFWKRATGADSGTYDFTWTGATFAAGSAHRISGAATSGDPFDVIDHEFSNVNNANSPATQATTTLDDTLLVWYATGLGGSSTWTPPSAFTEVFQSSNLTAAWLVDAAAGDTGALTGSSGNSDLKNAFLGAVKPAAAAAAGELPILVMAPPRPT